MRPEKLQEIKDIITKETNGWHIVEIAKLCQSELKKRNDGLKCLFE